MSFILDALKKSENERQEQSSAEFSSVPSSSSNPSPARWLWMLGILLFINFAVLIGILLKPSPTTDASEPEAAVVEESRSSFEEQVAVAIDDRAEQAPAPDVQTSARTSVQTNESSTTAPVPAKPMVNRTSNTSLAVVPTMDELRLGGSLQVAEMHLDIHVFSETPAERFVFINMNKHREGSKTAEGPVVREIRTDGVVLEHQGRVFLLPRQ
jgi:general secretion pathway protein B